MAKAIGLLCNDIQETRGDNAIDHLFCRPVLVLPLTNTRQKLHQSIAGENAPLSLIEFQRKTHTDPQQHLSPRWVRFTHLYYCIDDVLIQRGTTRWQGSITDKNNRGEAKKQRILSPY